MKRYSYEKRQVERKVEKVVRRIEKFEWKYRNLIFLASSVIVAYFLLQIPYFQDLISSLENLSYFGALLGGMFFSYGMTAAPATVVLFMLGKSYNPILIALAGALGSVVSDYIIFRFVKNRLMEEIKELSEEINNRSKPFSDLFVPEQKRIRIWRKVSRSKNWKTAIPIIAGFIVASPLPDELGVALFGAVKYEPRKFMMYSYVLHFIAILAISSLSLL